MTTIQAIETRYAGCRFRSRLEARWAVFFDHLDIAWEYEPEGYNLPSGRYLPDFWLPNMAVRSHQTMRGVWFEVKPEFNVPEDPRWEELAEASGKAVYVGYGLPRPPLWHGWETGWVTEWSPGGSWDCDMAFCDCWGYWSMQYGPEGNYHCTDHARNEPALIAARSARFEYGE